MRILIHTDEYYPTCAACANRMKVLADVFAQQGNEVTVIASAANRDNGILERTKERIIFAPAVRMKRKTTLMRMLNNLSYALTSVGAALSAGPQDVVITTSPPPLISLSGWLIARMRNAKLIYDVRDIWPDIALEMNSFAQNSLFCRIFRWITGFMYRRADWVTTVSKGKVESIRRKLPPETQSKVKLVGNGFDESVLACADCEELAARYDLDSRFTCVYIGNVGLAQGLGAMLDLAAQTRHPHIQFLIFGTGAEQEALAERARREGLDQVKFCGVIPHEQVATILRRAKISFIPLKSARMKDSIPTKVYEALGLGCPVLLVAEGEACELVNETGLGRCVSPDQPERLAEVFDDMVDRYELFEKRRIPASTMMCRKYSRQQIAREFEKELKETGR